MDPFCCRPPLCSLAQSDVGSSIIYVHGPLHIHDKAAGNEAYKLDSCLMFVASVGRGYYMDMMSFCFFESSFLNKNALAWSVLMV